MNLKNGATLASHITYKEILINTINTFFVHVLLSSFISTHQNMYILPLMNLHMESVGSSKLTRHICTVKRVIIQINKRLVSIILIDRIFCNFDHLIKKTQCSINMSSCQNKHHKNNNIQHKTKYFQNWNYYI